MHSNWYHCLQEVFNSGKLAEKSYHQNSKNVVSLWKISMISERVKKQQVPKEDDRSAIPVLKLATST